MGEVDGPRPGVGKSRHMWEMMLGAGGHKVRLESERTSTQISNMFEILDEPVPITYASRFLSADTEQEKSQIPGPVPSRECRQWIIVTLTVIMVLSTLTHVGAFASTGLIGVCAVLAWYWLSQYHEEQTHSRFEFSKMETALVFKPHSNIKDSYSLARCHGSRIGCREEIP